MKYEVTLSDGDTVTVNADSEAGALTHAEQLEQQEFDRAKALDPPLKYTKRTVQGAVLVKGEAPAAAAKKGTRKK